MSQPITKTLERALSSAAGRQRPPQRHDAPARLLGNIAKARAGNPRPFRTFGQLTTTSAPVGGAFFQIGHDFDLIVAVLENIGLIHFVRWSRCPCFRGRSRSRHAVQ